MEPIVIPNLDLKRIADSGQCFTWTRTGENAYAIRAGKRCLKARQEAETFFFSCTGAEWEAYWKRYFDLDTDYGAIVRLADPEDAYLAAALRSASGIRILRQPLWEVMCSFLISQNNNITRIRRSVEGLCRRYGEACPGPDGAEAFFAFPTPDALAGASVEDFAALGLGYRAKYMAALAARMKDGGLQAFEETLRAADDETAIAALMTLYGVGRKVAECICLFGLHRLDCFPIDTHIRKALARHYPEGFPRERFRGCSGVIQQYIFYHDLTGG